MTDNDNGTAYRKDALYVTEDTTVDEIADYLRTQVANPVVEGDNIIWNFSTHGIDWDALDIEPKEQDRFMIPYQVTGTWGFMFQLLPEELKQAEILVYHTDDEAYYAYRNFYRTTPGERSDQIKSDLSRRLVSECGEVLDLHE